MSFLGQLFFLQLDILFVLFPAFSESSSSSLSHHSLSLEIANQLLTDTTVKRKECNAEQSSTHPSTDNTKSFSSSYHSNQRNCVSYQIQYSTSANFRYFCHWHKTKQIQLQAVSTDSFLIPLPSKLDGYDHGYAAPWSNFSYSRFECKGREGTDLLTSVSYKIKYVRNNYLGEILIVINVITFYMPPMFMHIFFIWMFLDLLLSSFQIIYCYYIKQIFFLNEFSWSALLKSYF